jgi:hypothetical protein
LPSFTLKDINKRVLILHRRCKIKGGIADNEIASFWPFITSSVDRILLCLDGLNENDLNWRPLENANSLYVLATHTMGNVEENILGVLCNQNVHRLREDEFKALGYSFEPVQQRWHEIKEYISSNLA